MEKLITTAIHQNEICEAWTTGGTSFQFHVSAEAVDQIKNEVIRGLKSIPKRGAEVGGILFGSITKQGAASNIAAGNGHGSNSSGSNGSGSNGSGSHATGYTVEVKQIFAVPVEYRFGPSYRLSEADEKAFGRALHAWPERQAIGWYRSNTRPGNEPTPDDHALTAQNFPTPNVFLLLKPDMSGAISASVEISGQAPHEFAFGLFSFLDRVLNAEESGNDENSLTVFDIQGRMHQHVPVPSEHHPPDLPTVRKRAIGPTQVAIASALICGGVAAWALLRPNFSLSRPVLPTADSAAAPKSDSGPSSLTAQNSGPLLGLRAEYQGRSLLIQWDRQSPAILQASGAVFTMQQGQQHREIPLDSATLRLGGLMIRPNSSDLDLRLDVHTPGGDASQTLRVIGFREAGSYDNSIAAQPRSTSQNQPGPYNSFVQNQTAQNQSKPQQVLPQLQTLPESQAPKTSITDLSSNAAALPARSLSSARKLEMAALEAPPDIQAAPSSSTNSPLQHNLPQVPSAAPRPAETLPKPESQVKPENQVKPLATPESSVPSPDRPAATALETSQGVTPAKAIRRVQPQAPPNIRSAISSHGYSDAASGQVVNVEIEINERGEVTSARVASVSGPFVRLFEKNAVEAAKQWRFEPAKSGPRAIPSRLILAFKFDQAARW